MARATHMTIAAADRIRPDDGRDGYEAMNGKNGVRREVQVSVTYVLDLKDTDLTELAREKSGEVQRAHEAAWHRCGASGNRALNCSAPGRCSCRPDDDEDEDKNEDEDDPDDPQGEGMPYRHDPPPAPPATGVTRPYPAALTDHEAQKQNGNGRPPQNGRYQPAASQLGSEAGGSEPFQEPATGPQKILIRSRAKKAGLAPHALETLLYQQFRVWRVEGLSKDQAASVLDALERDLKEKSERKEGAAHADAYGVTTSHA